MSEPELTFDQTTELMAHVAHFGGAHLGEILRRKGVRRGDWDGSSQYWQAQLFEAARGKDFSVAVRYGRIFGDVTKRLEGVRLVDLGPLPEEVDETATESPAPVEEPAPPEPQPEPPPEVHSPPAVPTGVPLATALGSPPPAVASPWARPAATSPRPPVEAPRVAPPSPDVTGEVVPAISADLPFDLAKNGPAPAPAAPLVAAEGELLAGGTSFVAAVTQDRLQPSTPFGGSGTTSTSPEPVAEDVEGTAFMMAPFQEKPLPFEGKNPAPPAAAGEISHDGAGATSFVPAVEARPSAPMSPEAYARLVHATYQQPAAVRASVHEAHQLDGAKRAQLDAAMADYMRRQPEAFRVYMQWVRHLRRGEGG